MKTLFLDIDGCIVESPDSMVKVADWLYKKNKSGEAIDLLLNGVRQKFDLWFKNNYYIVLTTSRPESHRQETEEQLKACGLFWNVLLMNLPHFPRHIVNDARSDGVPSAVAHILPKNEGLGNLEI